MIIKSFNGIKISVAGLQPYEIGREKIPENGWELNRWFHPMPLRKKTTQAKEKNFRI